MKAFDNDREVASTAAALDYTMIRVNIRLIDQLSMDRLEAHHIFFWVGVKRVSEIGTIRCIIGTLNVLLESLKMPSPSSSSLDVYPPVAVEIRPVVEIPYSYCLCPSGARDDG